MRAASIRRMLACAIVKRCRLPPARDVCRGGHFTTRAPRQGRPNGRTALQEEKRGWDSLTLDRQHGVQDHMSLVHCLQAPNRLPVTLPARVPRNEPGIIGRVPDGGASGIICPMANIAEQAQALGTACRYPSLGERSNGPISVGACGAAGEYQKTANDDVPVVQMIETKRGREYRRDPGRVGDRCDLCGPRRPRPPARPDAKARQRGAAAARHSTTASDSGPLRKAATDAVAGVWKDAGSEGLAGPGRLAFRRAMPFSSPGRDGMDTGALIGILQCGTPPGELGAVHGSYPEMVGRLLGPGRRAEVFDVTRGELPRLGGYAAFVLTGSSAGVYDDLPWIAPLLGFLRQARGRARLVGICFGHQAMAQAFGGQVVKSPKGWGIGLQRYAVTRRAPWMDEVAEVHAAASHQDQVVELPPGAAVTLASDFTPFAGLDYGDAISFQFHPEFTPDFARALLAARRSLYGPLADAAAMSYARPDDGARVGAWISRFLDAP